jgi:hypothetical protein
VPGVLFDIEVVEHEGPHRADRREAGIELDETRGTAGFEGQEHHRLPAFESLGQEAAGPLRIGRLAVELAIAVEHRGQGRQIGGQGAADLHAVTPSANSA